MILTDSIIYRCIYALTFVLTLLPHSVDAGALYAPEIAHPSISADQQDGGPAGTRSHTTIKIDHDLVEKLSTGAKVQVFVPHQGFNNGVVVQSKVSTAKGLKRDVVSMENGGSVEILSDQGAVTKISINNIKSNEYYVSDIDKAGRGTVEKQDIDKRYCVGYHKTIPFGTSAGAAASIPYAIALDEPELILQGVQTLSSRPNSNKVILIDYWGGTDSNSVWTNNYNSGNTINYSPYDIDGDSTSFSELELRYMWIGWAEAAEDYAPFNVNITTDIEIYNNTAWYNRSRIIVTRTNYWNPGWGGFAWINSYGFDEYYRSAWVWNLYPSDLGSSISHEAGHQLGLVHDGYGSAPYYRGHGKWAPIMGYSPGRSFVQFSKGEYYQANNFQDDFRIINNFLMRVYDEAGSNPQSARMLTAENETLIAQISPAGINGIDIDTYEFHLKNTSSLSIDLKPWLVDQGYTGSYGSNLSYRVSLMDSEQNILHTTGPTPHPNLSGFNLQEELTSGRYFLKIEPESYDPSWISGFGDYGNGGRYVLRTNQELLAGITSPARWSSLESSTETFTWKIPSTATASRIWIGSAEGLDDFGRYASTGNSKTIRDLPTSGDILFVTLKWFDGSWHTEPSTQYFSSYYGSAEILSHSNGDTLSGSQETFYWVAPSGADKFRIWIGTTSGGDEIGRYSSTADWLTISDLPTGGSDIYATLKWHDERWHTEPPIALIAAEAIEDPVITFPALDSAFTGGTQLFRWRTQPHIYYYRLWIGSDPGGNQYGRFASTNNTKKLVGLPVDGSDVYVTLKWYDGRWRTAEPVKYSAYSEILAPYITSPMPSSNLEGASSIFTWTGATDALTYRIWLGSSPGEDDFGRFSSKGTSLTADTLPTDGSTVYATLKWNDGQWHTAAPVEYIAYEVID